MAKRYAPSTGYTRARQDEMKKHVRSFTPPPVKKKSIIDKFRDWSGGIITEASIQQGLASSSPIWRKRAQIVAGKMPLREKKKR